MAHFFLQDCKIILGSFDISSDLYSIKIDRSQAPLDNTTFGATFMKRIGGLHDCVVGMAGLMDVATLGQDEKINANMSLSNVPVLYTPRGATDFDRAKFGLIQQGSYQCGGSVGGRAEWSADGRVSNHQFTDGWIMAVGAKTGTFDGTWRELGSVSATQKLYAQIHATAKTAFTSAVFKVQSADDAIGTNATDRVTFATITDLTSEFATPVSGAITQTFWRLRATAFTGTSLTIYGAAGIA